MANFFDNDRDDKEKNSSPLQITFKAIRRSGFRLGTIGTNRY